ncbi:hypothetical protein [Thermococcus sp.]|nr:hypothetical protein [Thermococcus sp.]
MEELWIIKEFERIAELMPERAIRLIKKRPRDYEGNSNLRIP